MKHPCALILDHEMYHPEAHRTMREAFAACGYDTAYRRYFPHFTERDAEWPVVLIHAGREPGIPGSRMSVREVAPLARYVREGGVALLLYSGGPRGMRGVHENHLFNRVLEAIPAPIRINIDWICDDEDGYLSTLVPSSYLHRLPMLHTPPGSALHNGGDALYGGNVSSLRLGAGAAPLLMSAPSSIQASLAGDFQKSEVLGRGSYCVSACARVGRGYVFVMSRALIAMTDFTGRTSDKPLLPSGDAIQNLVFARSLARYAAELARGGPWRGGAWRGGEIGTARDALDLEAPGFELYNAPIPSPPSDCFDEPRGTAPGAFDAWVDKNKLRVGYGYIPVGSEENERCMVKLFEQSGLNTFFAFHGSHMPVKDIGTYGKPGASSVAFDAWETAARVSGKAGVRCFLGSLYPHWDAFHAGDYARLADASGKSYDAPSPLDIRFWRDSVFAIADDMARFTCTHPEIDGLYWDLEMYTFPGLNIQEGQGVEDASYFRYLELERPYMAEDDYREAASLPVERRFEYLRDRGLLKNYYRVLEGEVCRIAERLRERVRAINPKLELGLYNFVVPNNWFYRGFLRGLSTRERPIVLVTYEVFADKQKRNAALEGVYFRHCVGMLANAMPPDRWPDALDELAQKDDGYWIFPFNVLQENYDAEHASGDATIWGEHREIIGALARANRRIDARRMGE